MSAGRISQEVLTEVLAWDARARVLADAGRFDEAQPCYERLVELLPYSFEVHNNLGIALVETGKYARARRHYERALELQPQGAAIYSNLGRLLNLMGEYQAALAAIEHAIALDPAPAAPYINGAAVHATCCRFSEALAWVDEALLRVPNEPHALRIRLRIHSQLLRADQALEDAQLLVHRFPDGFENHIELGTALRALGRYEEAFAAYDRAAQVQPRHAHRAFAAKGALLVEVGRSSEARIAIDSALEVAPENARAWYTCVSLKTFRAQDPQIAQMEALLDESRTESFEDRLVLHFALGKACLDAGETERAFMHLEQGNRMYRSTFSYSADELATSFQQVIDVFGQIVLDRLREGGPPSERPVFIVGMPRSGTSLVEQILASHADVYGAGELSTLPAIVDRFCDDATSSPYPRAMLGAHKADMTRVGEAYLAQIESLAPGSARVIDKMPSNWLHLGLIYLALPGARIIHCRRDPVDTCFSCYANLFGFFQPFAYDLTELGRFYCSYKAMMDFWQSILPAERFTEVHYENLVAHQEAETRRLVSFCGLGWDDSCLSFFENDRPVRTLSATQVRQPVYHRSVGRWKPFARHLAPLLATLGVEIVV